MKSKEGDTMKHYDRAWAEIDLDALQFNIESIKNSICLLYTSDAADER